MIAVCIVTYNQEQYIAQAIDSVLAQKCDEPVRIYIGDDTSTDGTQTICERYAKLNERIFYIRREKNMGLVNNTLDLYRHIMEDGCEFIAMLDGDDYWIKEDKLQIQLDYLRSHPQVGFVHTAAYDDIDGQLVDADSADKPTGNIRLQYNRGGASHTNSTVVFRTSLLHNGDLQELEKQHFLVLDYPLYGIFSQHTEFGYLYIYTAAWRKHNSVSHPKALSTLLRYQFHYVRAWHWLDKKYSGHFHFHWYRAFLWYLWQFFYFLFAYIKKKL